MKLSIIVPVGNLDEWKRCEASLRESIAAYESAFRGNASTGEEVVVAEVLPCLDLEHRGAFVARNEGLARATGDWIAWVDCDDVVETDWFGAIAEAIRARGDCDVIQFDATEVKNGRTRPLRYGRTGEVSGEDFARELLRNDGMPAWLWTRVFRRAVLEGVRFEECAKEDYQVFLQILPRIRRVWSVGRPLYRYLRHGHGLSNYVQAMDYDAAGRIFEREIAALPARWLHDARVGLALTMADVAIHSKADNGSRQWVRKHLRAVIVDGGVPLKMKVKALLAAIGGGD